jgi:hypothetical protein
MQLGATDHLVVYNSYHAYTWTLDEVHALNEVLCRGKVQKIGMDENIDYYDPVRCEKNIEEDN